MWDEELDRIHAKLVQTDDFREKFDIASNELLDALHKIDNLNHMVFRLRAEIKGLNAKLELASRVSEFQ